MRIYAGDSAAGSLGMINLTLHLRSDGFTATGRGHVLHSGGTMSTYRYGCSMRHRTFPSLLLTQRVGNESAKFQAGSYWKLSGVRA